MKKKIGNESGFIWKIKKKTLSGKFIKSNFSGNRIQVLFSRKLKNRYFPESKTRIIFPKNRKKFFFRKIKNRHFPENKTKVTFPENRKKVSFSGKLKKTHFPENKIKIHFSKN